MVRVWRRGVGNLSAGEQHESVCDHARPIGEEAERLSPSASCVCSTSPSRPLSVRLSLGLNNRTQISERRS